MAWSITAVRNKTYLMISFSEDMNQDFHSVEKFHILQILVGSFELSTQGLCR